MAVNAGGQSSSELRFCLSHFPSRCTRSKTIGPEAATRSSCGAAPFVKAIRSSARDAAASRPTISITTGLTSVAVAAPVAGRPSPSSRCSLPYTHYSLLARSQALQRRFVEHSSWEEATPTLKDPNRVPDPSTLRRWAHGLDRSQPALSFLRQTLARVAHWLARGDPADHQAGPLSWLTPVLQILWPLRL